jgi:hypothetical protein
MTRKSAYSTSVLVTLLAGLFASTLLTGSEARASEVANSKKFGIGLYLGQPTGPTLKYHFTPKHAITGALGLGWWGGHNFHIHVDYGYHFQVKKTGDFDLVLWVGGGLKFFYYYWNNYHPYLYDDWRDRDYGRAGIGVRVPLGLAFNLGAVPLELFLEIAPGVAFLPWVDFFADGGIGIRYFF